MFGIVSYVQLSTALFACYKTATLHVVADGARACYRQQSLMCGQQRWHGTSLVHMALASRASGSPGPSAASTSAPACSS
jgi:hypothetical protein